MLGCGSLLTANLDPPKSHAGILCHAKYKTAIRDRELPLLICTISGAPRSLRNQLGSLANVGAVSSRSVSRSPEIWDGPPFNLVRRAAKN
jgi:hypothetical protein